MGILGGSFGVVVVPSLPTQIKQLEQEANIMEKLYFPLKKVFSKAYLFLNDLLWIPEAKKKDCILQSSIQYI